MSSEITLVGGPHDGERLTFAHGVAHGDTITFPARPPMIDFGVPTTDPIRFEKFIYRRSLNDPSKFVFQP